MREEGISTPRIRCTQREPLMNLVLYGVLKSKGKSRRENMQKKENMFFKG